jgi:dihydroxyacetone kinase-like protein
MDAMHFRGLVSRTLEKLPQHADELRDLDAALGDGDLGITVSKGSIAAIAAIAAIAEDADLATIVQAAGKAFSVANPSTFAALVGGGMLAASKALVGRTDFMAQDAVALGDAVAARIRERGKAAIGDKTILDALQPSLDAVRNDPEAESALELAIATARKQVEETASLRSAKGRAAWMQERSVGHPDPGATAYLRFLEALRDAVAE